MRSVFVLGLALGGWFVGGCWVAATMPRDGWFVVLVFALVMQAVGTIAFVACGARVKVIA